MRRTAKDYQLRRVCVILTLALVLPWSRAQSADQVASISSALHERDFAKALELLCAALNNSPDNPQLWIMQGFAHLGKGEKKEAQTSFEHALKLSPDNVQALQGKAQIEFDAGSTAAIPLLQRLLRLQPNDPTSHGMLAVLEYRRGNCPVATVHFEKAGALFDSQIEALHAYATCLVRRRKFEKATAVFQRALALNPDDQRERQLLASILLMAQKPQDALATLQPLLQGDTPDVQTLELASTAYEDIHDTERAVSRLRQAILLDPQKVNLYLDFANISSVHQSFQVGINVVNDGIGLLPKAAPLYFARGVLYVQLAEYEKAQADFERAYDLDPSQSLTAAAQGMAAVQANDPDRALQTVQAKLTRKPNDPILLYLQADVISQKGADPGTPDFQLAMRSAKKVVLLQPTLGAARGVLAKLYLQAGQNKEAAAESRKALASDPKDQAALYHLIQALRKTGGKEEIPELLKRLAALRQEATKEERERYRYRLVEGDAQANPPTAQ